jgi:hypothetical protein
MRARDRRPKRGLSRLAYNDRLLRDIGSKGKHFCFQAKPFTVLEKVAGFRAQRQVLLQIDV